MDTKEHLTEFPPIDVRDLREGIARLGEDFWASDRAVRTNFAGARPGDAVYYYNDQPQFLRRPVLDDVRRTGGIDVLRNVSRALFATVDSILAGILPLFPACDVMRVQLAELAPGEVIEPHRDHDILEFVHRLHLPIVTNDAVRFTIGGEEYSLTQGVLYELNNVLTHSVRNGGDRTRIHLLVDMLPHALGRARYHDDGKEMAMAVVRQRLEATRPVGAGANDGQ